MAKLEPELLSKNAYAKYLGINEKAVRNAVADGKIKKGWDAVNQKIIKHLADKEYGHLHQVLKVKPGVGKKALADKIQSEQIDSLAGKIRSKSEVVPEKLKSPRKSEKKEVESPDSSDVEGEDISALSTAELLNRLKITADMSYPTAIKYNEIIEAALKKKKLEELEDILIRKDKVENALYAFGSQLRKALLAIPARVVDDIINSENKVEAMNILTTELNAVLETHSNTDTIKLSNKN